MSDLTEQEKVTIQTYDRIAKEWSERHAGDIWEEDLRIFRKLLPEGRVLDVGCGSGRDAKELIKLGYGYLGIDLSENLLDEARKNNPGARFEKINLYDLSFREKFDGFWCSAVLIHVPRNRIDDALQAIKPNLKRGAIGFIAMKEGKGQKMEPDGRFHCYWQKDDFKNVLKKNSFKILHQGYDPATESSKWLSYHVRTK